MEFTLLLLPLQQLDLVEVFALLVAAMAIAISAMAHHRLNVDAHWRSKRNDAEAAAAASAHHVLRSSAAAPDPKDGVLSVKAFGAVGDGKTDDTDSIALALSSLGTGETMLFPKGTYLISRSIDVGGDPTNGLKSDQILQGTGGAVILAAYGGKKWYGEHCINIFGPHTTIRDLIFSTGTTPDLPTSPTGFGGLNWLASATFGVATNLTFRVRIVNIRACIVVDARGMLIQNCSFLCQNSPGHGIYISGGDYNVQQPFGIL